MLDRNLDNAEKSNKRKFEPSQSEGMDCNVMKIEEAPIKTETAVIEQTQEEDNKSKKPQMIAVIPDSAIRSENKKSPLKFIPLKLTDGKLIDAIPLKKIKVTVKK